MTVCTPECWTPVPCPKCGANLPPRGRSCPWPLNGCCATERFQPANKRHLWDAHDSFRALTDPDGWAAHLAECAGCLGVPVRTP